MTRSPVDLNAHKGNQVDIGQQMVHVILADWQFADPVMSMQSSQIFLLIILIVGVLLIIAKFAHRDLPATQEMKDRMIAACHGDEDALAMVKPIFMNPNSRMSAVKKAEQDALDFVLTKWRRAKYKQQVELD